MLFACEVGRHFDGLVLFGRTEHGDRAADYTLPPDVDLVELPFYPDLRQLRRVLASARGTVSGMWRGLDRVDRVWVFGPHPFGLVLVSMAFVRRKRVVLGVRQDTLAYQRGRMTSRRWLPALGLWWGLDRTYRLLARRLPITLVGEEMARGYPSGSRPPLPMIVSLVPQRELDAPRPELDYGGPIRLLTVGRFEHEKNPLLLVEALATLNADDPDRFGLTWVGRGELVHSVQKRARELHVDHLLEIQGYVPFGPGLLDLYRRSHAFVHVSLTEGVPQVLVEAMACSTPVVATAVGGVPGLLEDGKAGLLVPPDDADAVAGAVRRLVADPNLRRRLVTRAHAAARSLTLEAQAERTASFLGA